MKNLTLMLLLSTLAILPGCISTGKLSKVVEALGDDHSSIRLRITSIYGVLELSRVNGGTNTPPHEIAPDGKISVKHE